MGTLEFGILGLGLGAVYAMLGLGLVFIYRGSGIINFAQGSFSMVCAYIFVDLCQEHGLRPIQALALSVAFGAVLGLVIHTVPMRFMARASQLARLAATLAVVIILQGAAALIWGTNTYVVPSVLPTGVWTIGKIFIPQDRVCLVLAAVAIAGILSFVGRRTKFGLAISAVAEDQRTASGYGLIPNRIAAINWVVGGVLAAISGVLVTPIAGLTVTSLTLLIIPALAAAIAGRFTNYFLTLIAGLAVGVLQGEASQFSNIQGLSASLPLIVVLLVILLTGRSLPLRDYVSDRLPAVGTGRINMPVLLGGSAVLAVFVISLFSTSLNVALTNTFIAAIFMQSMVVLTGYAGQISLAVYALGGLSAFVAGRLVAAGGWPVEAAVIVGLIAAPIVGLVFAVPAFRARGVTLAVVTLCLGVAAQALIFNSNSLTGGILGTNVGAFRLFGIDLDPIAYPARFCITCLLALIVSTVILGNIRRGASGGRLLSVRHGERAASVLGVSVFGAKLYAFAVSALLAGMAGILWGFSTHAIIFTNFDPVASLQIFGLAIVGGIGFTGGALLGATLASGALGFLITTDIFGNNAGAWLTIVGGVVLVLILIQDPDGLFAFNARACAQLAHRLPPFPVLRGARTEPEPTVGETPRKSGHSLLISGISVRYNAVTAVSDVSLSVRSGEVVGLVGPNGAGKTSLFDAVNGLVPTAGGEIMLDGRALQTLPAARRARAGIGRSFQAIEIFDDITVGENLAIGADDGGWRAYVLDPFRVRNVRDRITAGRVAIAAAPFGLLEELDKLPTTLPFGKRRLVGIARALASSPSVLLLDEPAAGLDETESAKLAGDIRRLADDRGIGVLVIEHDINFVMSCSDKVVVMDFGEKIAEGTPEAIRSDARVRAAYLGASEAEADAGVAVTSGLSGPGAPADLVDKRKDRTAGIVLRAEGIAVGYGSLTVVRDVDLAVRAGQVTVLLGPNGSGKTTTLLALVGELPPRHGAISFANLPTRAPLYRRVRSGLAYLPEHGGITRSLSVEENLRVAGVPFDRATGDFPELERLRRQSAGSLSGGEQRMLSLARALGQRPSLLVIDEMSQGLAPMLVDRLLRVLRAAADSGIGVLLVEQHVRKALGIADHAYVMRTGRIQLSGPADEITSNLSGVEEQYITGPSPQPDSPRTKGETAVS